MECQPRVLLTLLKCGPWAYNSLNHLRSFLETPSAMVFLLKKCRQSQDFSVVIEHLTQINAYSWISSRSIEFPIYMS